MSLPNGGTSGPLHPPTKPPLDITGEHPRTQGSHQRLQNQPIWWVWNAISLWFELAFSTLLMRLNIYLFIGIWTISPSTSAPPHEMPVLDPFFYWIVLSHMNSQMLFLYFQYQPAVNFTHCNYLLPVRGLCFWLVNTASGHYRSFSTYLPFIPLTWDISWSHNSYLWIPFMTLKGHF